MNGVSTNSPIAVGNANNAQHARHSDQLLEASRRIDWRFLLPNPQLRNAAYVGAANNEHLRSLALFCTSLTEVKTFPTEGKLSSQYDIVIVSDPTGEMLRGAAELGRPGGFLYVEVYGLFSLARFRRRSAGRNNMRGLRLRHPAGYVALAEQLGFIDVQTHWHWPNFETCTKIIPLDNPEAIRYAFALSGWMLIGRLQSVFGRWPLWHGLVGWAVPCFSMMALRSSQ
jgi:hypothetical protein